MLLYRTMEPAPGTWERYWEGCQVARNELIEAYYPVVKYVAGKVAHDVLGLVERDDLTSHGVIGLMDAISKFNPERGVKFETYAITRIRGSIIDELRSNDWVPRSVRSNARKIEKARAELESQMEGEPTLQDIADKIEMPVSFVSSVLGQVAESNITTLDEGWKALGAEQGENLFLGDFIQDVSSNPESSFREVEARELVSSAVSRLGDKEQAVIALHYIEGLNLSEIGDLIGVTESRACQMHTKAVNSLHSALIGAL